MEVRLEYFQVVTAGIVIVTMFPNKWEVILLIKNLGILSSTKRNLKQLFIITSLRFKVERQCRAE